MSSHEFRLPQHLHILEFWSLLGTGKSAVTEMPESFPCEAGYEVS